MQNNCFEIKDIDLTGRIGKLKTKHGVIETPYIFPVIDPLLKHQIVSLEEIKSIGFNGIITNAYLLKKNIVKVANIHSLLKFDGVIMTDSGAYQILRYGNIEVSNREIVQYQCDIESDIGVILDIPTPYNVKYEEALKSAEITLQRAIEVSNIVENCRNILWTLPIQGGVYTNILETYAKKSNDVIGYGYSIYALGSPTTLLENYMFDEVINMVFTIKKHILPSYPLHLFGVGHPLIIPFVIALGVDLMDSASYILYAKDGRYITRRGTYKLKDLHYLPCSCPICSKYTVEELREMARKEVEKLVALHNLYVLYNEIKEVKECIKEGRLWEYLEEKSRAHPAAKKAFDIIKKFLEYIYSRCPYEKPRRKAVFVLSEDSVYNPKIMLARRKILSEIMPESSCILFEPIIQSKKKNNTKRDSLILSFPKYDECTKYLYHPVIGIIPKYLTSLYPFSQFEAYTSYSPSVVNDLFYIIIEYILKIHKMVRGIKAKIVLYNNIGWQDMLSKMLKEYMKYLEQKGINIEVIEHKL